jgi:hypothetical protein
MANVEYDMGKWGVLVPGPRLNGWEPDHGFDLVVAVVWVLV